jgi:hypothetical protein
MNIKVTNGERTIALTKSETKALRLAYDVCFELAATAHADYREPSQNAADGLGELITVYCQNAPQSKPEAAKA